MAYDQQLADAIRENSRLLEDAKMLKAKAENAKSKAIAARDAADLAVQYAIDCELLANRMLGIKS